MMRVGARARLVLAALALAGCGDPVVGGTCADGLVVIGGACVPPLVAGDAGAADAGYGTRDGGAVDARTPVDGGPMRDAAYDAGVLACDLGELECGTACVRVNVPSHCGGCDIACRAGELCADGACVRRCPDPLSRCDGACVDLSSDPDNCGGCGIRCSSGLCVDGACGGPTAGHVVVIGHDYRSRRAGMSRLVGNAALLAHGAPVRVLVFEERTAMESLRGVDAAIAQVAAERGRAWERTVGTALELTRDLAKADALVVYPQQGATDGELLEHGARWSRALSSFVSRGGVVVVVEGGGDNRGTHQVLAPAGLFAARGRAGVADATVEIVSPADAVAVGVPLAYRTEPDTFTFDTDEGVVVAAIGVAPVVVHRAVVPVASGARGR